MADIIPNIITTQLPDYVRTNREVLIRSIVLPGGGTVARMRKQTGIKKDAYLNYLDIRPVIAASSGCNYNPQGEAELTQRVIETGKFEVVLEICPETLRGKYAEYLLRSDANGSDLPFEEYLLNGLRDEIAAGIEEIIWQSDTADDGVIDGLLAIAAAEDDVTDVAIAAGTSAYQGLLQVYLSMPEETLRRGGRIYVGPAIFRAFVQEIVALNLYHVGVGNENFNEIYLPGTDVIVVKTFGLTGSLDVLGTFDDNLYYGTDLENDREVVKIVKDEKTDAYALIVKWVMGVQFAFPDQVVLGTFAAAPSAVTGVAGALGEIATAVTGLNADDKVFTTRAAE